MHMASYEIAAHGQLRNSGRLRPTACQHMHTTYKARPYPALSTEPRADTTV